MGIGIDLGGTTIKGGIVSSQGDILEECFKMTESHRGYASVLDDLTDLINCLLELAPEEMVVGIGIPGILSQDGSTVLSCPNLEWKNVALKKDLEARLTVKVLLVNDATAACIAESAFGSLGGKANAMMITLGTGVGGGLILNHKIITGAHGVASEVGHMVMGKNFYSCECGKNGCLETFASATALVRYCDMRLKQGVRSSLEKAKMMDAKFIVNEAKSGDALALEAIDRLAEYLGMAISNISDLVDPEIYAIGGGLSYSGEFLLEKISLATKKYLTYPDFATPEIVLARFRNEAGIIGAANLVNYI
ncbi:ROK family protein [Acetobacterium bakii]|uniref:Glucokinase n=1 Tax=Acetobacterium bakii TaxID=52689 RepID=A0A0L6U0P0_9FIRM|nr:ROK family protein [Acetobacterium bakii]KNZ42091.1 hypothetical protein AKG39_07925 [Acetobacterium bakii]